MIISICIVAILGLLLQWLIQVSLKRGKYRRTLFKSEQNDKDEMNDVF